MDKKQSKYDIPKGWIEVTLRDIITLEYGRGLTAKERREGDYNVWGANGVVGTHDDFLIEGPAIIVGRKGSVGAVHYSQRECWPIDTTYYINPFKSLSSRFIYYLLKYINLSSLDKSTTIPGLNREIVYSQKILLPPLNEQYQIVEKIEELFSELDESYQNLKIAKIKTNIAVLAVIKRVSQNNRWRQFKIKELCEVKYGKSLPKIKRISGNIPVYGSSGIAGYHNVPLVNNPSIIIGRKGNVGQLYFSEEPCFPIDTTFYIEETPEYNLKFIYYQLQIKNLPSLNTSTTIPGMNRENFNEINILIPNSIEEQKYIVDEIEEQLSIIDKFTHTINQELQRKEYIYQKILQQAYSGKLTKQSTNNFYENLLEKIKIEKEERNKQQTILKKNYSKVKVMEKDRLTITQILQKSNSPILAEELWKQSIHANDIDDFYAELKMLIEKEEIEELPRDGKRSYLKLKSK